MKIPKCRNYDISLYTYCPHPIITTYCVNVGTTEENDGEG